MKDDEKKQGQEELAGQEPKEGASSRDEALREQEERAAESSLARGLLSEEEPIVNAEAEPQVVREETSLFQLFAHHPDANAEDVQAYAEQAAKKQFRKPFEELTDEEAKGIIGDETSFRGFLVDRLVEEYIRERKQVNERAVEEKREKRDPYREPTQYARERANERKEYTIERVLDEERRRAVKTLDEKEEAVFRQAKQDLERFRAQLEDAGLDAATIQARVAEREEEFENIAGDFVRMRSQRRDEFDAQAVSVLSEHAVEIERIDEQEKYEVFGGIKRELGLSTHRMGDFMEKVGAQYPQMIRRKEDGEVLLDLHAQGVDEEGRSVIWREYVDRVSKEVDGTREAQRGSMVSQIDRSRELNLKTLFDLRTEGGRESAIFYCSALNSNIRDEENPKEKEKLLDRYGTVWSHILQQASEIQKSGGTAFSPEEMNIS